MLEDHYRCAMIVTHTSKHANLVSFTTHWQQNAVPHRQQTMCHRARSPSLADVCRQVHWLWEHEGSRVLMGEVEAENQRVWKFITEREIEAPERFRAIQSYRCARRPPPRAHGLCDGHGGSCPSVQQSPFPSRQSAWEQPFQMRITR